MPRKIARPQAPNTPETRRLLAEIEVRNARARPTPRPGAFDLDAYVDDLVAGVTERPGIVRAETAR